MTTSYEINFDGLVGPSHNYSGLPWGNEASNLSRNEPSNPLQAALQGLAKMKFLMDLKIKQGVLPPQERPHLPSLSRMGYSGTPETVLTNVKRYAPWAIRYVSSSSSMWAANAATLTPSIDSVSKKVQITPANLQSNFHRSLEADTTSRILKVIFPNPIFFEHHSPLLKHTLLGDEGAANHIRFAKTHFGPGVHLFAYGNSRINDDEIVPLKYPARQSKEASESIAKLHQIYEKQIVIAQQNPKAIDAGVFHNDVISTGNLNFFLVHEEAFLNTDDVIKQIHEKLQQNSDTSLQAIKVPSSQVSLEEAVRSYLFNSQIVSLPDGTMSMLAPSDCLEVPSVAEFLRDLAASSHNPIQEIHYLDLRQSMKNGGGPACLRLRVVLNETEFSEINSGTLLTEELYRSLVIWVKKHYRDRLDLPDLYDPAFYEEMRQALDELTQILKLGSIYSFQL